MKRTKIPARTIRHSRTGRGCHGQHADHQRGQESWRESWRQADGVAAGARGKRSATGKVIKSVEDKVGEATVTEVDDDSATATFSGAGPAKVGDVVKNP